MPPDPALATVRTWKRGTPAPSLAVAASKVFDLKLPVDEAAAGYQTIGFPASDQDPPSPVIQVKPQQKQIMSKPVRCRASE